MEATPSTKLTQAMAHLSPWTRLAILIVLIVIALPAVAYGFFEAVYAGRIFPQTYVGEVNVGGLTTTEASEKLRLRLDALVDPGITVAMTAPAGPRTDSIPVTVKLSLDEAVLSAMKRGRSGGVVNRLSILSVLIGGQQKVAVRLEVEQVPLEVAVENLARSVDQAGKDIRLEFTNGQVTVLTDTKEGRVLDQVGLVTELVEQTRQLSNRRLTANFVNQIPVIDPSTAPAAEVEASRMIAPLTLLDRNNRYPVSAPDIGSWLVSEADGKNLVVRVDALKVNGFVASLSEKIDQPARNLGVKVVNDKVVSFDAPRPGRVVSGQELVSTIIDTLEQRRLGNDTDDKLIIPVHVDEADIEGNAADLGIRELIGRATTTLTGSPANRIANIKNGVRFLSGLIIKPGEEFSTIGALGTIDNTTGYLPELVIRGNRTVPEFGGGLCQVSTTLFRSVLNAALPITARQNHSYRVSYYENDGDGKYIGPGLDATIYSPNPDFRFKNDTPGSILITGYVEGDRVTFELYGSQDGRRAEVVGPTLLSTVPAGEAIYVETNELEPGKTRQIERAHNGGSATATYTIRYADGREDPTVFRSVYRPWPAQYLIGVDPNAVEEESQPTEAVDEASPIPPLDTSGNPIVEPINVSPNP